MTDRKYFTEAERTMKKLCINASEHLHSRQRKQKCHYQVIKSQEDLRLKKSHFTEDKRYCMTFCCLVRNYKLVSCIRNLINKKVNRYHAVLLCKQLQK